jgi:hypothetical protein
MNPEKLFNDISKFVSDSRALLQQGTVMELSGLENRILLLCEEVLVLSQEERLIYAKRLQQLMADLAALGEEITAQRDAVAKEIQQLPGHKKANKAYRKPEADDKEDKK